MLDATFPGAEIILSEDGGRDLDPFNRSVAIMNASLKAVGNVLVVIDCDVWSDGIPTAVELVASGSPWAKPQVRVHRLTLEQTQRVYAGQPPWELSYKQKPYINALGGGAVVVSSQALATVPFDHRFIGWGYEDFSWEAAVTTLMPNGVQLNGTLFHLWHPPGRPKYGASPSNLNLWDRYRAAKGNETTIHELLREANDQRPLSAARQ
jgi:hypothetical protein